MKILRETSEKYGYSARVIHKLLRLARTSADLDGEEKIRRKDIEKVLTCRDLDNWHRRRTLTDSKAKKNRRPCLYCERNKHNRLVVRHKKSHSAM